MGALESAHMSNINYNRQFIQLDFEVLDDPKFLAFVGAVEFATYLILRRFIWRGGEKKPHFLGLHQLYEKKRLLVCSVSNKLIAQKLGLKDVTRISKHLSKLAKAGVIKRKRTGRQNIYVLGEWVDYSEHRDGSRRMEWFYLEQKFGVSQTDLAQKANSDLASGATQTWRKKPNNNREENNEENAVNGDGDSNFLKNMPNLDLPQAQVDYIADTILQDMGDQHSAAFYHLVAWKVPESEIRRALAEIRTDGAREPRKVFTHRMKLYALKQQKRRML